MELTFPDDAIEVGRVIGAWGVKGWIKVQPFSQDPQALFSSKRWFVRPPEPATGPRGLSSWPTLLKVVVAREHGDGVVAQVQDVDDRNGAEALKGARIFVARSSFPTPDEGEFYWVDLIGLQVVNRQGEVLGVVNDLLDTGVHGVLQVQGELGADGKPLLRLIPFVAAYVDDVDLEQRRILVDWGLDY